MATNIELYEVLKPHLDEKAARMLAESIPASSELATKADVAAAVSALEVRLTELRADLTRYLLAFFVPLWLGMFGLLGAFVLNAVR